MTGSANPVPVTAGFVSTFFTIHSDLILSTFRVTRLQNSSLRKFLNEHNATADFKN
jgi:hypothetical protein